MQDKVVYLTPEGKQRFTAELHELQTVKRHQVEEQIRKAKEFADTVDNAEYDEAKTEQGFVEGRIQELERMLSSAKLIEERCDPATSNERHDHVDGVGGADLCSKLMTNSRLVGCVREQRGVEKRDQRIGEQFRSSVGEKPRDGAQDFARFDWGFGDITVRQVRELRDQRTSNL